MHEKHQHRIWRENPGMISRSECIESSDPALAAFGRELSDDFLVCDLRDPKTGDGFSWGRYGPGTELRRFGAERLFAYKVKPSLWQRIFRRK